MANTAANDTNKFYQVVFVIGAAVMGYLVGSYPLAEGYNDGYLDGIKEGINLKVDTNSPNRPIIITPKHGEKPFGAMQP